jgi:hypothetical protein
MVALELQGLLRRDKTTTDPFSNRRLTGPRVVYLNRFLGPNDIAVADDDGSDPLESGDLPS